MKIRAKHLFPTILFFACSLFTMSCEKEFSFENGGGVIDSTGNQHTNTSKDSIYIHSIKRLKLNGSVYDTVLVTHITYDEQRRFKSWEGVPGTNPDFIEAFEFYYIGTDTLPYKGRFTHVDAGLTDTVVQLYYFFYDQARKRKDSVVKTVNGIPGIAGWVDNFYYPPGKSVTIGTWTDAGGTYEYADTCVLDANNNIISAKFYDGTGRQTHNWSGTYQYDNNKHPYSVTNISKAIPKTLGGGFPNKYSSFNNISYQKLDFFRINYIQETRNTYVYNRFGLPILIDKVVNGEKSRFILTYRSF